MSNWGNLERYGLFILAENVQKVLRQDKVLVCPLSTTDNTYRDRETESALGNSTLRLFLFRLTSRVAFSFERPFRAIDGFRVRML